MSNYTDQANEFCTATGAPVTATYNRTGKYFEDDKESRDIYSITIATPRGSMSFEFGQSIASKGGWTCPGVYDNGNGKPTSNAVCKHHGLYKFATKQDALQNKAYGTNVTEVKRQAPTAYDVLACITKNHPGTFEDFCSEYGYDTDSRKAEKTYYAVLKEYAEISRIFTAAQLEAMQEIS